MKKNPQWFLIETEEQFEKAVARYEEIKHITNGAEHREKLLLVHLIEKFENAQWDLPEMDPVEVIKVRMKDFGYRPADLATVYGDKGTISKVLNYKQHLSLTMIRKFSVFLRLPASTLVRDYELAN